MAAFSDFTTYASETAARMTDQPLVFEVVRRLDVPRQELFNYITDFSRLSEWISGAKKSWADDSNAEVPGQVGSVRVIQSPVGTLIHEVVKAYDAPRMLAYSAEDSALFGLCTDHLGVVTCERSQEPFSEEDTRGLRVLCDQSARRLGDLQKHDRWFGARAASAAKESLSSLFGVEHTFGKLMGILISLALAFLIFGKLTYRVEAPFI